jgi:hypothetical protein
MGYYVAPDGRRAGYNVDWRLVYRRKANRLLWVAFVIPVAWAVLAALVVGDSLVGYVFLAVSIMIYGRARYWDGRADACRCRRDIGEDITEEASRG